MDINFTLLDIVVVEQPIIVEFASEEPTIVRKIVTIMVV